MLASDGSSYIPEGTSATFEVGAFQIARWCITNAQFDTFIDGDYHNEQWWHYCDTAFAYHKGGYEPVAPRYTHVSFPRVQVSWYEAIAFCLWLSFQTGQNIMLPTEQQWMRAAQGDKKRIYAWGNGKPSEQLVNWNKSVDQLNPIDKVDSHRLQAERQPYGLYNMTGNVNEWCLTDYKTGEQDIHQDAEVRVIKGGSWSTTKAEHLRLVFRGIGVAEFGNPGTGFRIVRAL